MSCTDRLNEAKAALHKIALGKGVEEIQHSDGKKVRYSKANIGDLRSYISELEQECGSKIRRRAIGVRF